MAGAGHLQRAFLGNVVVAARPGLRRRSISPVIIGGVRVPARVPRMRGRRLRPCEKTALPRMDVDIEIRYIHEYKFEFRKLLEIIFC
jgi:hypothetical protein